MTKTQQYRQIQCHPREGGFLLSFHAMASPCELLIDTPNRQLAIKAGNIAAQEAWRIEDKYSRYQSTSVCGQLNAKAGQLCAIDQETHLLLSFADQCYQMSDGLFDLTSGVLRRAWLFDGSDNVPSQQQIAQLMPLIGWQKVSFNESEFVMHSGMEIDFGGIGKEYAVDRAMLLLSELSILNDLPMLINFGGDLAVNKARAGDTAWQIGIEHPSFDKEKTVVVSIKQGAIATSGDARRFLLKNGQRYSHILNVKTGWPVLNPPNSISIAAPKCIQAGFLATLALLNGENAETLLNEQEIKFWAIR